MQLYTNPASPFCRKVEITLHETDQLDDVELVHVVGNPLESPAMLAEANPIGKIPALILDDGRGVYDSRVICRFLDDRAGSGLYPADDLFEVLTLEATADGICDAAVSMVYEARTRPPEKQHAPWVEGQWIKATRGLDALADRFMPILNGPLTMGHFAVASALGYIDFRHPDRNWREGRDVLAAWHAEISTRPAMKATEPHA